MQKDNATRSRTGEYAMLFNRRINPHGTDFISRLFFYERDIRNKFAYGLAAPKSAELIYIDPSKVRVAIHQTSSLRIESGSVKGGTWDQATRPINKVKKVRGVKQRIVKNLEWKDTAAWQENVRYLAQKTGADGIRSLKDIERRYDAIDKFIADARQWGEAAYKTRRKLNKGNFREAAGLIVHIDRNGELVFGMRGCHRLGIAQALGMTCIPAQLGIVHELAVKRRIWRANLIPAEQARIIRRAARAKARTGATKVEAAAIIKTPIPAVIKAPVVEPTKQRYTGRTSAQSIEFDANKDVHWQGQTVPKFDRLVSIMPGNSLVEIGAAEGILSLTMAPHKERVRAIDITPNRHQKALELKARWIELGKPVENCEMVLGDALKHPELIAGFDTLMASRVIYYFGTYLEEFMDNVRKNVDNICLIGNPVRTAQLAKGNTGKLGEYAKYATVPGMIELVERHGFKVFHVDETLDPLILAKKV